MTANAYQLGTAREANRRAVAKAATRARLIDAARFLFINAGYFGTGIRDIADRMKMSTGAVFANIDTKAGLWVAAMGGDAPDERLAEEVALVQALRPGWAWQLRFTGTEHLASLNAPHYRPLSDAGKDIYFGRASTPAEALRQARIDAERGDAARATRAGGGRA